MFIIKNIMLLYIFIHTSKLVLLIKRSMLLCIPRWPFTRNYTLATRNDSTLEVKIISTSGLDCCVHLHILLIISKKKVVLFCAISRE